MGFCRRLFFSFALLYGTSEFPSVFFKNFSNKHVPIRLLPESLSIQWFSIFSGPREPRGWISLSTTVKDARLADDKILVRLLISKTCCREKGNLAQKFKDGVVFIARVADKLNPGTGV